MCAIQKWVANHLLRNAGSKWTKNYHQCVLCWKRFRFYRLAGFHFRGSFPDHVRIDLRFESGSHCPELGNLSAIWILLTHPLYYNRESASSTSWSEVLFRSKILLPLIFSLFCPLISICIFKVIVPQS